MIASRAYADTAPATNKRCVSAGIVIARLRMAGGELSMTTEQVTRLLVSSLTVSESLDRRFARAMRDWVVVLEKTLQQRSDAAVGVDRRPAAPDTPFGWPFARKVDVSSPFAKFWRLEIGP